MNIKISILVISRRVNNLIMLFDSITKQINFSDDYEILVSWNGYLDTSELSPKFSNINNLHVFRKTPYDFAKNCNFLGEQATGDILLFLNDDVVLEPNCLQYAIKAILNPTNGIVGINLRYENDTLQHAGVYFDDEGKPFHRYKHEIRYDDPLVSQSEIVPAVTGAFLLIRREEFIQIYFDEFFTVAGEDIILNLKYKLRFNRNIFYEAKAKAIHVENATRKLVNERLTPEADLNYIKKVYFSLKEDKFYRQKISIKTEKPGWIMYRKAVQIQKRLPNIYINESLPEADLHYYINYGYLHSLPKSGKIVANFTHFDPNLHANKFKEVAEKCDHCISVSHETAQILLNMDIPQEKITVIPVGSDNSFQPSLTLGIVGRVYTGGRKGEHLLQGVLKDLELMKGIKVVATNSSWGIPVRKCEEMSDFYNSIDYLLVTSTIEGGPVPFMEALACGTMAIAPPIGVIPDFPHIEYETGNLSSLKSVIQDVKQDYFKRKNCIASKIAYLDWNNWAIEHEKVFRRLLQ